MERGLVLAKQVLSQLNYTPIRINSVNNYISKFRGIKLGRLGTMIGFISPSLVLYFNPACCHFLPDCWREMAVLASSSQRNVANPLLNQVPWNAVLLKQRHSTVTKCMRRPDRDFELLAERLKNVAIHVPVGEQ